MLSREKALLLVIRAVAVGIRSVAYRVGLRLALVADCIRCILGGIVDVVGSVGAGSFKIVSRIFGVGFDIVRGIFLRALLVAGGESGEPESNRERGRDLHRLSPIGF